MRPGVLALALLAASAPAATSAKLLDIYAGPKLGGVQGFGEGGLAGLAWGLEVGAEVLLFDGIFSLTQVLGGKQSGATLTQFLLGIDGDLPLTMVGSVGRETFLRLGGAAGFALVTPEPVSFPIDGKQVSHRGLAMQGTLALERHLGRFVIVGLELGLGYRYFLASETIAAKVPVAPSPGDPQPMPALASGDWGHGFAFTGLFAARVHFEPFGR